MALLYTLQILGGPGIMFVSTPPRLNHTDLLIFCYFCNVGPSHVLVHYNDPDIQISTFWLAARLVSNLLPGGSFNKTARGGRNPTVHNFVVIEYEIMTY